VGRFWDHKHHQQAENGEADPSGFMRQKCIHARDFLFAFPFGNRRGGISGRGAGIASG
jgi:hypothetical protein